MKEKKELQDEETKLTAKEVMKFDLEECSQFLDAHNLDLEDIAKFCKGLTDICKLSNVLPTETLAWAIQKGNICTRIAQTNFCNWYDSKKVLTSKEYCELEDELNKDREGISMKELMLLTKKDEMTLLDILYCYCGLLVINHDPIELVMSDNLYINLIPLVNDRNQLTGLKMQYLFKSKALSTIAENIEEYDFMHM